MRCLKTFGERIVSRNPDHQTAKTNIRIVYMNHFNALDTLSSDAWSEPKEEETQRSA